MADEEQVGSTERTLAIAVPSCCRAAEEIRIGYTLQSLACQLPSADFTRLELYLWDEGDLPVTADRSVRMMIDLLGERGHRVTYLRRSKSSGVAAARRGLLEAIPPRHARILMIDDDFVLLPDAIGQLLATAGAVGPFGFVQGVKLELDRRRVYHNDMNRLNRLWEDGGLPRLYFGDAAFLLLDRDALRHVRWDVVTRFREEGLGGEDVAMTLLIADRVPCYGAPRAVGYHLSLAEPRWRWEVSSDALQFELLRPVISADTLRKAMPHLSHYLDELVPLSQPSANPAAPRCEES